LQRVDMLVKNFNDCLDSIVTVTVDMSIHTYMM